MPFKLGGVSGLVECTHHCINTQVRPCKEEWPDNPDAWCGACMHPEQDVWPAYQRLEAAKAAAAQQRDELLAALKEIVLLGNRYADPADAANTAIGVAKRAIAKAEAK